METNLLPVVAPTSEDKSRMLMLPNTAPPECPRGVSDRISVIPFTSIWSYRLSDIEIKNRQPTLRKDDVLKLNVILKEESSAVMTIVD